MKLFALAFTVLCTSLFSLTGCSSAAKSTATPSKVAQAPVDGIYRIGAGDALSVFVWRNPEFSTKIPVRPDGRISMPLVDDMMAVGKTPRELADEIEVRLSTYIKDPIVTVIVTGFVGTFNQQIRVVGEALQPKSISYQEGQTILDVMINVGGLTEFAAGNRATLIRTEKDGQKQYRIRLDDLLKRGDITANVTMRPGDIVIIPESWL